MTREMQLGVLRHILSLSLSCISDISVKDAIERDGTISIFRPLVSALANITGTVSIERNPSLPRSFPLLSSE